MLSTHNRDGLTPATCVTDPLPPPGAKMVFTEAEWEQYRIENMEKRMSGQARKAGGDTEDTIDKIKILHGSDNMTSSQTRSRRSSKTHTISNATPRGVRKTSMNSHTSYAHNFCSTMFRN